MVALKLLRVMKLQVCDAISAEIPPRLCETARWRQCILIRFP